LGEKATAPRDCAKNKKILEDDNDQGEEHLESVVPDFMVNLYDTSGYTALGAVAEDIAFDSLRNLKTELSELVFLPDKVVH